VYYLGSAFFFLLLNLKLLSFEYVKDFYANDNVFSNKYEASKKSTYGKFYRFNGYLFRKNRIYMHDSSIYELLVREA
jgi:hypothetical protein